MDDANIGQVLRHCVRDEAGPGVHSFEKVPDNVDPLARRERARHGVGSVGAADASDDAVDLLANAHGEVSVSKVEQLESTNDEASHGWT